MSRIGKQLISLPAGVSAQLGERNAVTVKGPKGELTFAVHPALAVTISDGQMAVAVRQAGKRTGALWGTARARLAALVEGVSSGFNKQLELQGVGYRAAVKGDTIELMVGFSHTVRMKAPAGISFAVEKEIITVSGADKELVGQVTANLRAIRPPEPYKGKGIRYVGEHVRRKVGKVVGTTTS